MTARNSAAKPVKRPIVANATKAESAAANEVAYQHERLAEAVGGLEHEAGPVSRELEQNAAGLAEVDGLGHLAIQHGRRPEPGGD